MNHQFKNAWAALLLCGPLVAWAGVIVAPVSATSDVPIYSDFDTGSLVDQSGLSRGYTSGVTDFDAYIGSNPTHSNFSQDLWAAELGRTAASLTFDLGGPMTISSLALWNRNQERQGIRDFSLWACPDAACTSAVDLGDFTALTGLVVQEETLAQVFGFAATTASFVRMDIANGYSPELLTMSEVAFERVVLPTDVPEPASLALVALGLTGVAFGRRAVSRR